MSRFIYSQGNIIKLTLGTFMDQLDPNGSFNSKNKDSYLKDKYNLTFQGYVNLVFYGDENYINKCKYCNEPTKFLGRLQRGTYYQPYCNNSCSKKHENEIKTIKGIHPFQSKHGRVAGEFSKRLNEYNRLGVINISLYLAEVPEGIKIGVTNDIDRRSNYRDSNYKSINEVRVGDCKSILELERDLKLNFLDSSLIGTEIFPSNMENQLKDFIINY